jgi:hypothetical protein
MLQYLIAGAIGFIVAKLFLDETNSDLKLKDGGKVIVNPTEIECHKCHWKWKVKDGGDDLFICHKCYTDNSKYYKFEGLKGQKILETIK